MALDAVRGLSASTSRSTNRLNAIAALRAVTMHSKTPSQLLPTEVSERAHFGGRHRLPTGGSDQAKQCRDQGEGQRKQRVAESNQLQHLLDLLHDGHGKMFLL